MPEKESSPGGDAFVIVVILARVLMVLVLWLGVFMSIFLGYFTVPILLFGLAIVIYAISDLGLFVVLKRRRKQGNERKEFLKSLNDASGKKK